MIVATQGQIQEFYKGGSGRIFFKGGGGGGGGGVQPLLQINKMFSKKGGGGRTPWTPFLDLPLATNSISKGVYLLIGHANKIDCFSGPPTWGKNFLYGDHMSRILQTSFASFSTSL